MGKTASSAVGEPARRETGHFRNYWEHCGIKSAKALHRESRSSYRTSWNWKVKKEIPAKTLDV